MKLRINNLFYVIVLLFSKEGLKQPAKVVSLLKLEPRVSSFPTVKSHFCDFLFKNIFK